MHDFCLYLSRLGTTELVNKIKIYTNLIKLFHFEIHIILFLFQSSIKICNNIWEYHLKKHLYKERESETYMKFFC